MSSKPNDPSRSSLQGDLPSDGLATGLSPTGLSHLDARGRARMVDVGAKEVTDREAEARARVHMSAELVRAIRSGPLPKGDLASVARLAGILAAKRTDELIPLCHTLPLNSVEVHVELAEDHIEIRTRASTTGRTGVEMEALVAATMAALTVVDMGKAVDPHMVVDNVRVTGKRGGRSGSWGTLAVEEEP